MEIEACPRRWALGAAQYGDIWNGRGYPRGLLAAAVEGSVVHLALEKITATLVEQNCISLKDASSVSALRSLGGFSVVLTACVNEILDSFAENPRVAPLLKDIRREVTARVPLLRSRVQQLLSRILFSPRVPPTQSDPPTVPRVRQRLLNGSHAEVRLSSAEMGWHGVADLLSLSTTDCEIRDFKTGAAKETHSLQLKVYALLWHRDSVLNPDKRLVTKLVVSYDDRDAEIAAPTTQELDSLEAALRERTSDAITAIQSNPPIARPSQESCSLCSVRQLCPEYWRWLQANPVADARNAGQFTDVELVILRRHGPNSWDCTVRVSGIVPAGTKLLLHAPASRIDISAAQILRLINVHLLITSENAVEGEVRQAVATMGRSSEGFVASLEILAAKPLRAFHR